MRQKQSQIDALCAHSGNASTTGRCIPVFLFLAGFLTLAGPSRAQGDLGPITIGAGLQTSYAHTDTDGSGSTDQFQLNDARIYISGPVTDGITFMFNTDYDSITKKIGVLDAVAEFAISPSFNIWAGRFLPPSDRANFYGPFYSHDWAVYNDGIQGGYSSAFQGRDNGVGYWGDFNKVKVSVGGFAGTGKSQMIGAARVQVDFWDKEDGYYLNGPYYGDKNLLAIGGASQIQDGRTASTIDFLLEKQVLNGGAFSVESEYSNYNRLGGYIGGYLQVITAQTTLTNERYEIDIQRRRMDASVLLIKALGGGLDINSMPSLPSLKKG